MQPNTPDYSAHVDAPTNPAMARLSELVQKLHEAKKAEALAEQAYEEAKKARRQLEEFDIPDLMITEIGQEEALTTGGLRVRVKTELRASLPKDPERRAAALQWVIDSGNGSLIKDSFEIKFDRTQHGDADAFAAVLEKLELPVGYDRSLDLHHQTMLALLREKLSDGTEVPMDLFGAYSQRIAKIVEKK